MPRERIHIVKEHLILCEGIDAENFLISYFNSAIIQREYPRISDKIQVIDFGGNENLSNKLKEIRKLEGFESLENLIIIRDAETNYRQAIEQVITSLQKNDFEAPPVPAVMKSGSPNVGFLLFPSCSVCPENGTLEDLCCSIIRNEKWNELKNDVDDYIANVEEKYQFNLKRKHKNKLHLYFSSTNDFVSLKIGEAANAGAFDWSSERLNPLRDFLDSIFVEQ